MSWLLRKPFCSTVSFLFFLLTYNCTMQPYRKYLHANTHAALTRKVKRNKSSNKGSTHYQHIVLCNHASYLTLLCNLKLAELFIFTGMHLIYCKALSHYKIVCSNDVIFTKETASISTICHSLKLTQFTRLAYFAQITQFTFAKFAQFS